MADTVDVKTTFNGRKHKVFSLQNRSDGTGESAVQKVDISTFTDPVGNTATYSAVDRIVWSVWGFNYVLLEWDHTTNDEIATLSGQGDADWSAVGGRVDPRTSGDTGDVLLTTSGTTANSGYDITLYLRPKA